MAKDLGRVTAYAYAMSKGYTGTEEEYAELMAAYGDVGQTAVDARDAARAAQTAAETAESEAETAATQAAGSATTASGAASTATQKAGEASTSANNAAASASQSQTYASNAEQSATAASGSADAASGSASAAAGSASAASQSETNATQSATAAAASADAAAESARTLTIDTTLTQPGQAAEAKATGDELANLKSHLNATEIVDTASGAVASFPDGSDGVPVESLTVSMEPIQDLHGQDAPYPPGGGKNLLQNDLTSRTYNGITVTVNEIGEISLSGTATETTIFVIKTGIKDILTVGENYILSGCSGGGNGAYRLEIYKQIGNNAVNYDGDTAFTMLSTDTNCVARIVIANGTNMSGVKISPMIRLASVSDSTFAPYSNICPISGRQSVTVTKTGVNVWDEEWESGSYDVNGRPIADPSRIRTANPISVVGGTSYYMKAPNTLGIRYYDINDVFISSGYSTTVMNNTSVAPDNAAYLRFSVVGVTTYGDDISINYPSTDHDYHHGTVASVEVQLGQTVYGGTVDVVSGELTVTMAAVDMGTLNWTWSSSYSAHFTNMTTLKRVTSNDSVVNAISPTYISSTYTAMASTTSQIQYSMANRPSDTRLYVRTDGTEETKPTGILVYELNTPQTYQLTPVEVKTLLGQNNIFADTGNVSVEYPADTKLYIDGKIADLQAMVLENINNS